MRIRDVLSINLKYYRKILNLPQEKFADIIGTSLSYLNQIENKKVDVRSSTIDKFANNLNNYSEKLKITSLDSGVSGTFDDKIQNYHFSSNPTTTTIDYANEPFPNNTFYEYDKGTGDINAKLIPISCAVLNKS